jgi:hypothetical protein
MPTQDTDGDPADDTAADAATADGDRADGPVFSRYGIVSALLALITVAAIAAGGVIWSTHRHAEDTRAHQSDVLQAAAAWTTVLINMNADNVEASMAQLRDGTVGELNSGFDRNMAPYRELMQKLKTRTSGQIDAVALETVHNAPAQNRGETLVDDAATSNDTVRGAARSVSDSAAGKGNTIGWLLRLGVVDVDGTLMISSLETLR